MVVIGDQELLTVLTGFHREVFLPDMERIVSRVVGDVELRMNRRFAEMHRRLDRLELARPVVEKRPAPDVEP